MKHRDIFDRCATEDVDCWYKRLRIAVYGATKPEE
jgi:hypothetical protein